MDKLNWNYPASWRNVGGYNKDPARTLNSAQVGHLRSSSNSRAGKYKLYVVGATYKAQQKIFQTS